jgi:hypothetical protein
MEGIPAASSLSAIPAASSLSAIAAASSPSAIAAGSHTGHTQAIIMAAIRFFIVHATRVVVC